MKKIFKSKTTYLIIFLLFSSCFLGPERVFGFVFGSESNVVQWIRENTTIRLHDETNDIRVGTSSALFVDTSENKLGIGTNTPTSTLSVIGNSFVSGVSTTTTQYINNLATNYLPYASTSGLMANSGLYWDNSNQRLGIGTVVPATLMELSAVTPEFRITDSSSTNYSRLTREATNNFAYRKNKVLQPVIGKSLEFSGGNDGSVNCGHPATLDFGTGSFTISAWYWADSTATAIDWAAIAHKITGEPYWSSGFTGFYIGQYGGGANLYTQAPFFVAVGDGTNNFGWMNWSMVSDYGLDAWHLITIVVDRATNQLRFYIDGILRGSPTDITGLGSVNSGGDLIIGKKSNSFDGKIDDVRAYNRALTTTELLDYYTNKTIPSSISLQGLWTMDEGSGVTVHDASGNGSDGTITNATFAVGIIPAASNLVETNVWSSRDGINDYESGINTYGDGDARAVLDGKTIRFNIGGVEKAQISASGNIGIGITTPTATLHLKAGTAMANTAPLKFTSGTLLSSPEGGVVEYDGTNFYLTSGSTRKTITTSSGGSANKASCWKSDGSLGYCSDVVGADGSCTCN